MSNQRVVWDTCVVIDAIQKTPGRWTLIEPLLHEAQNGQLQIVVSEITVAETTHFKRSTDTIEAQVKLIRDWFENQYIVRRPVYPAISELAAFIGRMHGVKRATDTIILATAVHDRVPTLHTFDEVHMLPLDGKLGGSPPLKICLPDPKQFLLISDATPSLLDKPTNGEVHGKKKDEIETSRSDAGTIEDRGGLGIGDRPSAEEEATTAPNEKAADVNAPDGT